MTLNDLERPKRISNFNLYSLFGARCLEVNEDEPIVSAAER